MDKKGYEPPHAIEDLMRVYYGPDVDGKNVSSDEISRYEDFARTEIISPQLERLVEELLSPLGELDEVRENKFNKVPDYEIKKEKIYVEVTSINTSRRSNVRGSYLSLNMPENGDDVVSRLNKCVQHVESKRNELEGGHLLCGVVFYDVELATLKKFHRVISDQKLIERTNFMSSHVEALAFVCMPASINGKSSWELYPPIFYVKGKPLFNIFSKISGSKIIEVSK
jgi:hypothetical protein